MTSSFLRRAASVAVLCALVGLPLLAQIVVKPPSSGGGTFGANVATFLTTPTSANLAAAVTDETGSGLLAFATGPTLTAPVGITGVAGSSALTITGATQTASFPVIDASQTWNNAGVTFTGLKFNVTDTASSATSNLADLQLAGATRFKVQKDGVATITSTPASGIVLNLTSQYGTATFARGGSTLSLQGANFVASSGIVQITSNSDTQQTTLTNDATSHVLAQRATTNAQTYRLYNTYTDSSNYERATWNWASNVLHFGTANAGTGTARVFQLDFGGTTTAAISIPITSGFVTLAGIATSGTGMAVANVGANSCGTTAATIAGNDNNGEITVGATSGTQCRITFTKAAATRWDCAANNETTAALVRATYVDTTHVDVLGAMVAGDVLTYHCTAR